MPNTAPVPASESLRVTSTPAYIWSRPFVHLIVRSVVAAFAPRRRISGVHHVPRRGPVILCPNHLSDADPPFVSAALRGPVWWMAKRPLFEMPIVAPLISYWQTFPVDTSGADRAALHQAEELLRRGQRLVVFPEGRCSPTGELGPILPGATLLALRTGAPIVPVGLSGTNRVVPFGSMVPRPTLTQVNVYFAAPLRFDDLAHLPRRAQREAATEQLEKALRAAVAVAERGS